MKNQDHQGMLFDIIRTSDRIAGRVGANVGQPPVDGATFNPDENRWERRLTIDDLAAIGREYRLELCFPPEGTGDLPIVEIVDADDDED